MNHFFKNITTLCATLCLLLLLGSTGFTECAEGQLNLNTASVEELQEVNGIGAVLAQRIVDYRDEQAFETVEEITEVKGIGEKTAEKIQNDLCVE